MTEYISRVDAVGVLRNAQFEYTCDEAAEFLLHIPAADVRPVVRGKWKHSIQGIIPSGQCSNCGAWDKVTHFCPNCGADMREKIS